MEGPRDNGNYQILNKLKKKNVSSANLFDKIFTLIIPQSNNINPCTKDQLREYFLINPELNVFDLFDENGNSLLHACAIYNRDEILHALLDHISLTTEDREKYKNWIIKENSNNLTALEISIQKGNKTILIRLFKEYMSEKIHYTLKEGKNNIFHLISLTDNLYLLLFFYENLKKDTRYSQMNILEFKNQLGMTPLHQACQIGNLKMVEYLLDLEADINSLDNNNYTPLHFSILSGNIQLIKKMIIHGSNLTIKNSFGKTPFHLAREANNTEVAFIVKPVSLFEQIFCFISKPQRIVKRSNDIYLYAYLGVSILVSVYTTVILGSFSRIFNQNEPNNKDILGFIFIGYTIMFLIIIICFQLFCRNIYQEKRLERSLTDLSEKTNNIICLICKIERSDDTVHCIICDKCVEGFHHHCFWLNSCISKKNMCSFIFVFTVAIGFMITKVIFYSFVFIMELKLSNSDSMYNYRYPTIMISLMFLLIGNYVIVYLIGPLVFFSCRSRKENKKKKVVILNQENHLEIDNVTNEISNTGIEKLI